MRPIVLGLFLAALAPAAASAPDRPVFLIAVGDVASCDSDGDEATAKLVAQLPGTIALLGDAVYERGTDEEFARCFQPSWGRFRRRIRPALGNHEYAAYGDAAPYFRYFGSAARPPRGYYSYRLGAWHVLVLNSNCTPAGGCGAGSAQELWLRLQLASNRARCTVAYSHHPRFSSGLHGSDESLRDLWRALYEGGADVVLSGHDHHYERFAPQTPEGKPDRRRGLRQFVVGTGGGRLYRVLRPLPASEVRHSGSYGVLSLRLDPGSYRWRFVPVDGERLTDTGTGRCH